MEIGKCYNSGHVKHLPASHWAGAVDNSRDGRGRTKLTVRTKPRRVTLLYQVYFIKIYRTEYWWALRTGTTLPGCAQGRRFCHADMRPVHIPAWETDLAWLTASSAEAKGDGNGGDPLLWPGPLRSRATPAGRTGLGGGQKIPEPGKADALLEEGRDPPVRLEMGCQCNSKGRTTCGSQGVPMAKPDQSPWPPPSHPPSKGPAHPGARPSRDGMVADGMYVWECSSEGPYCLGRPKQSRLSVSWRSLWTSGPSALTAVSGLRWTSDSSPGQNPAKQSPGVCAFELVSWAGDGL